MDRTLGTLITLVFCVECAISPRVHERIPAFESGHLQPVSLDQTRSYGNKKDGVGAKRKRNSPYANAKNEIKQELPSLKIISLNSLALYTGKDSSRHKNIIQNLI